MELSQGYIDEINFDGTMKIRNGPTIRINDPNAVFSAGFSAPFMVSDDKSPSVSSFSGFPMCVPRSANDTLCPLSQRPLTATGNPVRIFQAVDNLVMAPFLVGDFIMYRGFWSAAGQLVCFDVVAWNVQITTVGAPTYIRIEATLIGVYSDDTAGEVAETRYIGYTSDPSVTTSIQAIDLDPCTGEESFRSIGVAQNRIEGGGRNKWLLRMDGTQRLAYTREYRAVASNGVVETRNGILAGQYIAPILEWIQPELLEPGHEPLIHEFDAMTHLTQGVGPDADGNIWGPLSPFPQSGVTTFNISSCAPIAPPEPEVPGEAQTPTPRVLANIATATGVATALFARNDDTFTLRGLQDNPSPVFTTDTLTYAWTVVAAGSAGTQANLATFTPAADGKSIALKFATNAPTGAYLFQLAIASAGQNTTGTATYTVNLFTGPDTLTIEAVTWTSTQSGTISVTCRSNYRVDSKINMQVTYPGDRAVTTSPMAATPPGSGFWAFSARKVDRPGVVSCQSSLGGFVTRAGTTAKRDWKGMVKARLARE
ncbi:hypothetical protein B0T25DRAFT_493465 [Lasiosphaeria hispida]|uniref:Uncharacterized protein n=1 Tax=Lasiosphaeria hispida TaxID=260671 RepID=A0AAJ0HXN5_9PEZI|nr:hypothetical protein B0T25DRAFT_493465 [Lasiosphaeria hispida]